MRHTTRRSEPSNRNPSKPSKPKTQYSNPQTGQGLAFDEAYVLSVPRNFSAYFADHFSETQRQHADFGRPPWQGQAQVAHGWNMLKRQSSSKSVTIWNTDLGQWRTPSRPWDPGESWEVPRKSRSKGCGCSVAWLVRIHFPVSPLWSLDPNQWTNLHSFFRGSKQQKMCEKQLQNVTDATVKSNTTCFKDLKVDSSCFDQCSDCSDRISLCHPSDLWERFCGRKCGSGLLRCLLPPSSVTA